METTKNENITYGLGRIFANNATDEGVFVFIDQHAAVQRSQQH